MRSILFKKRILLVILVFYCFGYVSTAQVSKTVTLTNAGTLETVLTSDELNTVTDLTVNGPLNPTDFVTMRDNMPVLENLDLSDATLANNEIPNRAFNFSDAGGGKTTLKSVVFPASVKTLKGNAFRGCTSLDNVDLSSTGLETIEGNVFWSTTSMKTCLLPATVTRLDGSAFRGSGIESIDLSMVKITDLGDNLFQGTASLNSVILPATLTKISASYIFYNSALPGLTIPKSVETINFNGIYENANQLVNISIDPDNAHLFSQDNAIYSRTDKKLISYLPKSLLTKVTVPEGVEIIGSGIFRGKNVITEIDLPSTLTTLESQSIRNMSSLTTLICRATTPPECDPANALGVFWDTPKTASVYVPEGTKETYLAADGWEYFNADSYIDHLPRDWNWNEQGSLEVSVAGILNTVFTDDEKANLSDLKIIGKLNASDIFFMRDQLAKLEKLDLSEVTIEAEGAHTANYIPEGAFMTSDSERKGKALTEILLPNNLKGIKNMAFRGCRVLKSLAIPASVNDLSPTFIDNTDLLESIDVKAGNEAYKTIEGVLFSFDGKTLVKYPGGKKDLLYTTPAGVETIGAAAFFGVSVTRAIIVNEGVTAIKNNSFQEMKELESIILPSTLLTIGSSAFKSDHKLVQIVSLATTPPYLEGRADLPGTFWDSWALKGLGVPAGSEDEYKKKADAGGAGWGNFFEPTRQEMPVVAYKTVTVTDGITYMPYAIKNVPVIVIAEPNKGEQSFAKWTSEPEVTFKDNAAINTYFVMPSDNVTITAVYLQEFNITVVGGTSPSAKAVEGAVVSITADAAPSGKRFYRWVGEGITFANAERINTTFTMLGRDVTITAEFKDAYAVNMVNGYAFPTTAVEGETVEIVAEDAPVGERFVEWFSEDGVTFADKTQEETTFIMPAKEVTISAAFRAVSGTNDIKEESSIIIYPNPAAEFIQVNGLGDNVSFCITNSLGQIVKKEMVSDGETISVSALSSGIYFFSTSEKTMKFIKK